MTGACWWRISYRHLTHTQCAITDDRWPTHLWLSPCSRHSIIVATQCIHSEFSKSCEILSPFQFLLLCAEPRPLMSVSFCIGCVELWSHIETFWDIQTRMESDTGHAKVWSLLDYWVNCAVSAERIALVFGTERTLSLGYIVLQVAQLWQRDRASSAISRKRR